MCCPYGVCVVTERERKTKKSCKVTCKNREVDKAVYQAIFDRKGDECLIDVKERLLLRMMYVLKMQCTIQSSSNFWTG